MEEFPTHDRPLPYLGRSLPSHQLAPPPPRPSRQFHACAQCRGCHSSRFTSSKRPLVQIQMEKEASSRRPLLVYLRRRAFDGQRNCPMAKEDERAGRAGGTKSGSSPPVPTSLLGSSGGWGERPAGYSTGRSSGWQPHHVTSHTLHTPNRAAPSVPCCCLIIPHGFPSIALPARPDSSPRRHSLIFNHLATSLWRPYVRL